MTWGWSVKLEVLGRTETPCPMEDTMYLPSEPDIHPAPELQPSYIGGRLTVQLTGVF
jgi:hypothetical protein